MGSVIGPVNPGRYRTKNGTQAVIARLVHLNREWVLRGALFDASNGTWVLTSWHLSGKHTSVPNFDLLMRVE